MHIIKNKRPLNWRPLDFFQMRDPVGIRTQDPQLRRLLLYPAELPDHPLMDLVSFSQASSTRSFTYGSATQNIMHGHVPTQFADAKVRFFSEPHK